MSDQQPRAAAIDPFAGALWTWPMAEAWIMYQHPDAVRSASGEGTSETAAVFGLEQNPRTDQTMRCRENVASAQLLNAIKAGELVCLGCTTTDHLAKSQKIPPEEFGSLKLSWSVTLPRPGALLLQGNQLGLTGYDTIRLRRDQVLTKWAVDGGNAVIKKPREREISEAQILWDAAKKKPFWNSAEALLWLMYHDLDRVGSLFGMKCDEGELLGMAATPIFDKYKAWLDDLSKSAREIEDNRIMQDVRERFRHACMQVRSCGEAGTLVVSARRNGEGVFIKIPQIEWTILEFNSYFYPSLEIGITAHAKDGGWPCYLDLTFEREALMRSSRHEGSEVIDFEFEAMPPQTVATPPRGCDDAKLLDEMAELLNSKNARTRNEASGKLSQKAEPKTTPEESRAKRLRGKFNKLFEYDGNQWVKRSLR